MKKAVVLLDKLGFTSPYYSRLDGGQLFPVDRFDVRLITTVKRLPAAGAALQSIVALADFTPEALHAAASFQLAFGGVRCSSLVALTERLLLPAAALREKLGIDGDQVEDVRRFRDKVVMKRFLGGAGIRVPRFAPYSPSAARDLLKEYQAIVVKPRAEAGSKDVHVITEPDQLHQFELKFEGRWEEFEAEEFIDGQLFHIDSVVENSQVIVATAGRSLRPTTSYQTLLPYRDINVAPGPLLSRLLAFNQQVLSSYPHFTGVTHHEVFVTADDIVFCEIAGRWGGGGIRPSFFHNTGIDIIAAMLQAQLGEPMPVPSRTGNDITGYTLVYAAGERMQRDFHLAEPWVLDCRLRVRAGDVPKFPTAWDRSIAAITVRGETEDQVAERLSSCEEAVLRCFR